MVKHSILQLRVADLTSILPQYTTSVYYHYLIHLLLLFLEVLQLSIVKFALLHLQTQSQTDSQPARQTDRQTDRQTHTPMKILYIIELYKDSIW